ncbi:MAG TPA: FUSC family membrane protein [Flavisolibacter sp.]|nr:FUSC family membrane protein [Flavisolibacter sp.]
MNTEVKEIRYFFYTQAFADGLKMAFAILLPSIVFSLLGNFNVGLTISLGSLCVCLADGPGPIVHKKNGMLICSCFVFLVAFITVFARQNIYTLGIEIIIVAFFFSMLNVYGNRAISVGNASILIMILTMDKPIPVSEALSTSLLIFSGGIFYTILSLSFYTLRPYRNAQRILGECIREIASYLNVKADFYDTRKQLDLTYKKLFSQQIVVHEKQDACREILFKTRQIIRETTNTGRKLVWTFVETVDLFEEITASYYDYEIVRKQFGNSAILNKISSAIRLMAADLDKIGIVIQSNTKIDSNLSYNHLLAELKKEADKEVPGSSIVLKKILVNLRTLVNRISELYQYFQKTDFKIIRLDHTQFISHQSLDPKILFDNLNFNSSVFRHAVRVLLACTSGYIVSNIIAYGHHSYWIIMTIAFMLKPAFSLTKQRNIERIIGTFVGGAIGMLILYFIPNKNIQLALMIIFMIGTYSFMRIKYLVMVICTTPYILILFNFLGLGFTEVAKERILDTVIGCTIAFLAGYLLFPTWESAQIKNYLEQMVKANTKYLVKIDEQLRGLPINMLEYKLARKEVYVASANLSSAFQRMLSEPKSKQTNEKLIHQFVVLNHILLSNIATVITTLLAKEPLKYPDNIISIAEKSLKILNNDIHKLDGTPLEISNKENTAIETSTENVDNNLLKEQLNFICKLSSDIDKTIDAINAE